MLHAARAWGRADADLDLPQDGVLPRGTPESSLVPLQLAVAARAAAVAMFAEPTIVGTPAEREFAAGQGRQRGNLGAGSRRPRSPWSVFWWQGRGEKVGKQLIDALVLVVMDPVRGVRQALDTGQIGHVVVLRLS